jgi:hypothetical protein
MRRILISFALLLPFTAIAADYNDSPLVQVAPNFPAWAVSQAGQNTSGLKDETPATPESPNAPNATATPAGAVNPTAPVSPKSPPSPAGRLWPRDTQTQRENAHPVRETAAVP